LLLARISISLKLLLLSALPLLMLAALLYFQGKNLYQINKDSYQTEFITGLALTLDNIAHQHAIERGLTAAFLGSNGTKGKDEVLKQRKKSDQSVKQLENFVYTHQSDLRSIDIKLDNIFDLLTRKSLVRGKVDQLRNNNNAFTYYSSLNKKTIDTIDQLTSLVEDNHLRSELNSMISMLWLKELSGQSRGVLNGVYAKGSATIEDFTFICGLIKDYDRTLELLTTIRVFHTKANLIELAKLPLFNRVDTIQNDFLSQPSQLNSFRVITPKQWFTLATQRIEKIRAIIDAQALYISSKAQQNLVKSQRYLMVGGTMIVALLLAIIGLSYCISRNISARILNIEQLLTRSIATNDLSIIIDDRGNDEVSHIAKGINNYIDWLKITISNAKKTSLKYEYLSTHDPLTKLANRSLFFSRLSQLTDQLQHVPRHHAILYIDIDCFKKVNDTYDHATGDKLLQHFANRLVSSVRAGDTLARLGGDEFAIILEQVSSEKAHSFAQKLVDEMKKSFFFDKLTLNISISIGMTFFPTNESQGPKALLEQADHALYIAKKPGGQKYQFFDDTLREAYEENAQLEADLEHAITAQQIFPHFQPQYCLQTQKIIGLEALARWQHPEKGFIPPDKFIPLAEKMSLITLITESIMRQACKNLLEFIDIEPKLKIAINISGSECSNPHILHITQQLIDESQIKPEQIELEVTESVLIENYESSIEILTMLHDLGIGIAIDDFGTGYSSLSYLTELPIDVLKIDMSFVQGIGINPQQEIIVKIIIDLAKKLSLKVLAEGIETQAQADFLIKHGCDYGQGYFYSKPCSAEDINKLFKLDHLK
jgi:diguanylate cyclase (GGDEF)-like protein